MLCLSSSRVGDEDFVAGANVVEAIIHFLIRIIGITTESKDLVVRKHVITK